MNIPRILLLILSVSFSAGEQSSSERSQLTVSAPSSFDSAQMARFRSTSAGKYVAPASLHLAQTRRDISFWNNGDFSRGFWIAFGVFAGLMVLFAVYCYWSTHRTFGARRER